MTSVLSTLEIGQFFSAARAISWNWSLSTLGDCLVRARSPGVAAMVYSDVPDAGKGQMRTADQISTSRCILQYAPSRRDGLCGIDIKVDRDSGISELHFGGMYDVAP